MSKYERINYSEYVGLVGETNRPSGGIKTVQTVCVNAFIDENKKVLEIGCNTGFTSLNITRLTNAQVIGIDLVEESLKEAKRRAKSENLNRVNFIKASATDLTFEDESFDVVWLSNVLSFIEDKSKALGECLRVLKKNGFLVFVPIYYIKPIPEEIIHKVGEAIGTNINVRSKNEWIKFIKEFPIPTEIIYNKDYVYENASDDIGHYLEEVFEKDDLNILDKEEFEELKQKGKYFMELFNENLKYAGYSIFIIQKRQFKEEKELFLTAENETRKNKTRG